MALLAKSHLAVMYCTVFLKLNFSFSYNSYITEKFQWHHRESHPRPYGPLRSASINCTNACPLQYLCMYIYIGFKTFFYVVWHLDSIASYLPTGLHLGFFCSWPSLFLPSNFSSVFLVLSFVLASTSMLFWAIFLLPFFEHGRTMSDGSVRYLL